MFLICSQNILFNMLNNSKSQANTLGSSRSLAQMLFSSTSTCLPRLYKLFDCADGSVLEKKAATINKCLSASYIDISGSFARSEFLYTSLRV